MRKNLVYVKDGTVQLKLKCESSLLSRVTPKILEQYNNAKHSSIKMTPVEASKKKNESAVYYKLYGDMKFALHDIKI